MCSRHCRYDEVSRGHRFCDGRMDCPCHSLPTPPTRSCRSGAHVCSYEPQCCRSCSCGADIESSSTDGEEDTLEDRIAYWHRTFTAAEKAGCSLRMADQRATAASALPKRLPSSRTQVAPRGTSSRGLLTVRQEAASVMAYDCERYRSSSADCDAPQDQSGTKRSARGEKCSRCDPCQVRRGVPSAPPQFHHSKEVVVRERDDALLDLLQSHSGALQPNRVPATPHRRASDPQPQPRTEDLHVSSTENATRSTEAETADSARVALRQRCERICACHWSDTPDMEMPINPASHAATCPCYKEQLRYDHVMDLEQTKKPSPTSGTQQSPSATSSTSYTEEAQPMPAKQPRRRTGAASPKARRSRSARAAASADAPPAPTGRSAVFTTATRTTLLDAGNPFVASNDATVEGSPTPPAASTEELPPTSDSATKVDASPDGQRSRSVQREATSGATPGPGAYNAAAAFVRSSRNTTTGHAMNFGSAARFPADRRGIPGPGTYDLMDEVPALQTPGSGKRDPPATRHGRSTFMASASRQLDFGMGPASPEKRSASVPGPGKYRPENAVDSRHPSPRNVRFNKSDAQHGVSLKADAATLAAMGRLPGPADYDVRTGTEVGTATCPVAMGPGTTEVRPPPSPTPGPGAYHIDAADKWTRETAPSAALGAPHAPPRVLVGGPGPGHYDHSATTSQCAGPQWTIGGIGREASPSMTEEVPTATPGPGAYLPIFGEPPVTYAGGGGVVMGTAPRWAPELDGTAQTAAGAPGPMTYDTSMRRTTTEPAVISISQAPRVTILEEATRRAALLPGPGEYDASYALTHGRAPVAVLATTSARFPVPPSEGRETLPGPGAYDAPEGDRVPGAAIGTAQRPGMELPSASLGVGPGSYTLPTLPSGPSMTMGQRLPDAAGQTDDVPGPGMYELQNAQVTTQLPRTILGTSSPRFPPSTDERAKKDMPGPGSYNPDALYSAPSTTFSTSAPRGNDGALQRELTQVGPGSYDPESAAAALASGRHVSFAQAVRFATDAENASEVPPGPGAYDAADPRFTQRGAFLNTTAARWSAPREDVPGPASYEAQDHLRHTNPATVVFGQAPARHVRDEPAEGVPGPGSYSPQEVVEPKFATFPTAPRGLGGEEKRHGDGVGPGHYEIPSPSLPAGPVFGAAPRTVAASGRAEDIPGPGTYEAPAGLGEVGTLNGRSFTSAPRRAVDAGTDTPGPGAYMIASQAELDVMEGRGITIAPRIHAAPRTAEEVPGPGAYDAEAMARPFAAAPTVRFGAEPRFTAATPDVPGPGAYDAMLVSSMPSYSFGSPSGAQTRSTADAHPGPGSYDLTQAQQAAAGGRWGSAERFSDTSRVPATEGGPGQYNPRDPCDIPPSHTFSSAPSRPVEGSIVANVPGPGAYDVDSGLARVLPGMPVYGFGRAPNSLGSQPDAVPGPGHYPVPPSAISGPSYSFGAASARIHELEGGALPGPGAYDLNSGLSQGPSVGFSKHDPRPMQPEEKERQAVPGPGSYPIDQIPGHATTVKMPKAVRFQEPAANTVPGPGSYTVTTAGDGRANGPTFGRAMRTQPDSSHHTEAVPGPGSYSVTDALDKQMAGRSVQLHTTAPRFEPDGADARGALEPGPGQYDVVLLPGVLRTGPKFTTAERFPGQRVRTEEDSATVLGPGAYEVPAGMTDHGSYSFGQSSRMPPTPRTDVPPPGSYDPALPRNGAGPTFPTDPRFYSAEDRDAPGPGAYDLNGRGIGGKGTRAAGMAGRPADAVDRHAAEVPGPGTYNAEHHGAMGSASPAFTLTGRPPAQPLASSPGPGAYDLAPSGIDGPAFSFVSRRPLPGEHEAPQLPGPGAYDVRAGPDGPAITIAGKAAQPSQGEAIPGPGAYDASSAYHYLNSSPAFSLYERRELPKSAETDNPGPGSYAVRPPALSGPASSFGTAPRVALDVGAADIPGPGSYHIPTAPTGPAASFPTVGHHHPGSMDDHPGPGSYSPRADVAQKASPAVGFGTAPRNVPVATDGPGPGMYQGFSWPDGRAPTFAQASQRPDPAAGSCTPGPGAYYSPAQWYPPAHDDAATLAKLRQLGYPSSSL